MHEVYNPRSVTLLLEKGRCRNTETITYRPGLRLHDPYKSGHRLCQKRYSDDIKATLKIKLKLQSQTQTKHKIKYSAMTWIFKLSHHSKQGIK